MSKKWKGLRRSHRRRPLTKKRSNKKSGSGANDVESGSVEDDDDGEACLWDDIELLEPYMKVNQSFSNMVCFTCSNFLIHMIHLL